MTVGSQISASVPSIGTDALNASKILNVVGSEIETATKFEGGMIAFALDSTGNKQAGQYYGLDVKKKVWQNFRAALLFPAKAGMLYPRSSTFSSNTDGIGDLANTDGTVGLNSFDSTNGDSNSFTTGAVSGNQAGFRNNRLQAERRWNPLIKMRFKVSVSTNYRVFLGFQQATTAAVNSDDPLNALGGIGLCKITTSGNWQIAHNDSSGVTIFNDTGIAADTNVHDLEIWADGNGLQFWWSLDKSTPVAITTDIPSDTSQITHVYTLTTTAAAGIVLSVFIEAHTQDK